MDWLLQCVLESRFLRGHNSVCCWPPHHDALLSFIWCAVSLCSILGCPHLSQIRCSSRLRGAAQIAQYFLAKILWQPWISEVRTAVSRESSPLRHVACWNVLLLRHDHFFHSNTARICIESYTGPNNIFTETRLLSSKDAAPLPPDLVTSGDGTKLALQLCEQLLCWLLPDFPAHVVWATDKTQ